MTIGLQAHLVSQTIQHQCLLRLCQTNLWRNSCKAHARSRAGTRTTLSTADDDEVSLRLCHTCRNRAHTALCHELHTDGSGRVDVLQVEDELGEVFDGVDVVMWWGRDEADARNGVTRLGDNLVHLEARQLSTFTGLGSLCHLNLYFFCIHEVFSRHAETS